MGTIRTFVPSSTDDVCTERLELRLTVNEMDYLRRAAESEDITVAGLLRMGVGLPVRERGGTREGAGRPPNKKRASKSRVK